MVEREKNSFRVLTVLLFISTFGISVASGYGAEETIPKMGPVKMSPHPTTLEGGTVLLRWNGKYNGDKFLARIGEPLAKQVKNVKVIKVWEVDPNTAIISKKTEVSDRIASKIAMLKPNIVVSAQAD